MVQINLTDRTIQSLKGREGRYYVCDKPTLGLRLWVSKSGKKTWALSTRDHLGRMRQFWSDKPYPLMGLSEARQWAIETRVYVKSGGDPKLDKYSLKLNSEVNVTAKERSITLAELVEEYATFIGNRRKTWERGEAAARIKHVFKKLLNWEVTSISLDDIDMILMKHPSKSSASRARLYLAPVFDWAGGLSRKTRRRGNHRRSRLQVVDIREAIDPQPAEFRPVRMRDLSDDEVKAILPHLKQDLSWDQKGKPRTSRGPIGSQHGLLMQMLLLTAARLNEVVELRWGDICLKERVWRKRNVKNTTGKLGNDTQILPLSDAVVKLILSLPHEGRQPNERVFKSAIGTRLGNWHKVTKRIQRLSGTSNWHRHDLREWAATTMAKNGVPIDVYERILNHSLSSGSASRKHYDRYARLEEQREALEMLAVHTSNLKLKI